MLALIVETAHQNGLTVMVHVNFPGPIATVIDAGLTPLNMVIL